MTGPTVAPSANGFLQVATDILHGRLQPAGISPARAAFWVTRRGLEQLVTEMLARKAVDVGQGNMRSKLICLSIAYYDHPHDVAAITMAWDQLSRGCHHHAYELTPTVGEARHVIESLRPLTQVRPDKAEV